MRPYYPQPPPPGSTTAQEHQLQLELPIGEVGYIGEATTNQKETWKSEGRCPVCGELGRIEGRSFSMICSQHGAY